MHNNAYSSPGRCFPFCPIFFSCAFIFRSHPHRMVGSKGYSSKPDRPQLRWTEWVGSLIMVWLTTAPANSQPMWHSWMVFFLFVDVRRRLPHSKWQPKAHTEVPPEGQRKSLLMRFEVFGLTRGVLVLGPGAALALDSVTRQPIKVLMNTREWLVAPTRSRKHVKRYANTPWKKRVSNINVGNSGKSAEIPKRRPGKKVVIPEISKKNGQWKLPGLFLEFLNGNFLGQYQWKAAST